MNYFQKYSKEVLLLKILAFVWFFTKIYTYKLWISDRFTPTIPVFEFLNNIPNYVHLGLLIASLLSLILIFFRPFSKKYLVFFLFFEIFSCLQDYSRWQPWEYEYLLIFFIFIFAKNQKHILKLIALLLIATYVISGLHKINGGFLFLVWESMILFNFLKYDLNQRSLFVHYAGIIIPIIEISIGLGLLLFKNKKLFIFSAITMHLFVIYMLSPLGINYNHVVIPWNFLLIIFIIILFNDEEYSLRFNEFYKFDFIFVLLVCILPLLNFIEYYDDALSFNLYSGKNKFLVIQIENIEDYPELEINQSSNRTFKNLPKNAPLYINSMAMDEMKVAIYGEDRAFIIFKKQWKLKYPKAKFRYFIFKYPFNKQYVYEI